MAIPKNIKDVIQETILDFEASSKLKNHQSIVKIKLTQFREIYKKDEWSLEDKIFLENHYKELKDYNFGIPLKPCQDLVKEAETILNFLNKAG